MGRVKGGINATCTNASQKGTFIEGLRGTLFRKNKEGNMYQRQLSPCDNVAPSSCIRGCFFILLFVLMKTIITLGKVNTSGQTV
jgi:hypothetical protein